MGGGDTGGGGVGIVPVLSAPAALTNVAGGAAGSPRAAVPSLAAA